MTYSLYAFLYLQSSVVSDLRTERGNESIWDSPFTAIIGVILIGYLLIDYLKSKK